MVSKLRGAAIGLLGLYWLGLFVGTHIPVALKGAGNDKMLHFLAFTGLAFLMSLGLGGRRPSWRTFALVLVLGLTYGAFDEVSQMLVGRHCDFWDWCADALGTCAGMFGYWTLVSIYQVLAKSRAAAKVATS